LGSFVAIPFSAVPRISVEAVALDVSKKEWQSSLKIFGHGGMSNWAAGN
jgi:hypothetical protein